MKSLSVLIAMFFVLGCVEDEYTEFESVNQAMDQELPWDQVGLEVSEQVTITSFDRHNLQLFARYIPVTGGSGTEERTVALQITPDTDLIAYPVTGGTGKCACTEEKWNWALTKSGWSETKQFKHITDEIMNKVAKNGCSMEATWLPITGGSGRLSSIGFSGRIPLW